jgi:alanine racemase
MSTTAATISPDLAGAVLDIDLDAIAANFRLLRETVYPAVCAGVVKADAYGCGIEQVAPALWDAGCRIFFVAHISEGITLRAALPAAEIYILSGLFPGTESTFEDHGLWPVLNDIGQIDAWSAHAKTHGARTAIIHIDTGMNRLGLPPEEFKLLLAAPDRMSGIEVACFASHLASADQPDSPQNQQQLDRFKNAMACLPGEKASLANSSGIFLNSEYHFDLARPGVALYGSNPTLHRSNPMHEVVKLTAKIIQLRQVEAPEAVGYGATYQISGRRTIATVPVGYADGYLRSIGNQGYAIVADTKVPVVGRVSMDLITLDVTEVPINQIGVGTSVTMIGGGVDIDELGASGGSMSYELLTSLGARYARRYHYSVKDSE